MNDSPVNYKYLIIKILFLLLVVAVLILLIQTNKKVNNRVIVTKDKKKQELKECEDEMKQITYEINSLWKSSNHLLPRPFGSNIQTFTCEPQRYVYVPNIIYINIKKYRERNTSVYKTLRTTFPHSTIFRLEGVCDSTKGLGILKSHIMAIYYATLLKGPTLIVEDDFKFEESTEDIDCILENFFTNCKRWDVFMFAPLVFAWARVKNFNFMRIYKATLASCYLLHEKYKMTLLNHYMNTIHFLEKREFEVRDYGDQTWHQLQEKDKWYSAKKMLGNQQEGYTTGGDWVSNKISYSKDLQKAYKDDELFHKILLGQDVSFT